jgi:hypothetical protein
MANLTPLEKFKIIEDTFQNWFRKAYELKDYTDVDVDLLIRDLPGAKREGNMEFDRYFAYDVQFKSTIKIPPQYQESPQSFINALGKYFVDSAKFLYKDQVRYEYYGSTRTGDWCRICVYKSCGSDVGCFCAFFQLEGNLVVAEVSYQIFGQVIPLVSPPDMLKAFDIIEMAATGRDDLLNSIATIEFGERFIFEKPYLYLTFPLMLLFRPLAFVFWPLTFVYFFIDDFIKTYNQRRRGRLHRRNGAISQDLSPIHFPVKYFNHDDFNEAFTKSHDHQIFFKQLQEVVNRMSALGESSNS